MENNNFKTGLKPFSTGIVARSATTEDRGFILVFPIIQMAEHDGELLDIGDMETMIKTAGGGIKHLVATKEVTVTAQWLNKGGSDRFTPPLVRHGETVELYQLGNTDQYYWSTLQNEADLRRRDSVMHAVGNTEVFGEVLNTENTYYHIVDTINKTVKFRTNDNDGELTWYEVTFKTDEGWFELKDGKGNFIKLDSVINKLTVEVDIMEFNASKSYTINSPLITFNTTDFIVKAKKTIHMFTQEYLLKAMKTLSLYTTKYWIETIKHYNKIKEFIVNTDSLYFKARSAKYEAKITEIPGGDITMSGGSLTVGLSTSFNKEVTFSKPIFVNGYAAFKGARFSGTATFKDGTTF